MTIKYRKTNISLLCFAVFGFAIGWVSNSYLAGPNEFNPPSSVTKANFKSSDNHDKALAGSALNSDPREIEPAPPKNPETPLENLLKSIINESSNTELTASRIINYITFKLEQAPFFHVATERDLRKLLREFPNINHALIEQYAGINEPQTRLELGNLLAQSNMSRRPFLEPQLMEKIKQNEDRSAMLELLGQWGSQSKQNIDYLAQEIPFMENPEDTAAAIAAISRSSWVSSNVLSPEEFNQLTSLVNNYRSSEHPKERAAAIAALRTMPSENYQQQIIKGLNDQSAIVREQALGIYAQSPFDSKPLVQDLIQRVQDQGLGYGERSRVAYVLQNLELSENQAETVDVAQREIKDFLSSLSEQEKKDLYLAEGS